MTTQTQPAPRDTAYTDFLRHWLTLPPAEQAALAVIFLRTLARNLMTPKEN